MSVMNIETETKLESFPTGVASPSNAPQNGSECAGCEDHTAINIPSDEAGAPPPQTDHDHDHDSDMFNRGSSAWRRALLTEFECEDSKEGLRELFGTEREDALIKLAYANFIREYSYFRRFDLLNFVNITLMQDELVKVQQEVESKRSPFSQENPGVKFRNLLETYNKALLSYHQVCNLAEPPELHVIDIFQSREECQRYRVSLSGRFQMYGVSTVCSSYGYRQKNTKRRFTFQMDGDRRA